MPPSGILHRVSLVRTNVSEGRIASIIRMKAVGELGTRLTVTTEAHCKEILSIIFILMMEAIRSFETSVLTRATRRNIPEDGILLLEVFHKSDPGHR
jgi:hypothetical protein